MKITQAVIPKEFAKTIEPIAAKYSKLKRLELFWNTIDVCFVFSENMQAWYDDSHKYCEIKHTLL